MIEAVGDADPTTRAGFDEVIDVRSPAEFAEDHLPGALNLPVLTDAQRAEVGALYVQTSRFLARKVGAAHVSRNIADHLAGPLADRPGGWRPLIYCWRGGQRSNSMAAVLSQVGWRVGLLEGGYRTYRRAVQRALYEAGPPLPVVLLRGPTGVGKTALLQIVAGLGVQVLDLEGLAAHRGSIFGDLPGRPQPSQKLFESRLAAALEPLDTTRPILVEAESSRIGALRLPPRLWAAMRAAAVINLAAPLEQRVARIVEDYGGLLGDQDALNAALAELPRHHSRERREAWRRAAQAGDAAALARALLLEHYDPAYARSAPEPTRRLGAVTLADGSASGLATAAGAVARLLS